MTKEDRPPIQVWEFEDAPEEFRALSQNGGDEDWIALIPAHLSERWIGWLEQGSSFGCCDVHEFNLPDGKGVRIGSHA